MSAPEIIWQIVAQSDLCEGRGPMRPTGEYALTEQEAWDMVGNRPGVQGCRANTARWGKFVGNPAKDWQDWKRIAGFGGDYDVLPVPRINPTWEHGMSTLEARS